MTGKSDTEGLAKAVLLCYSMKEGMKEERRGEKEGERRKKRKREKERNV